MLVCKFEINWSTNKNRRALTTYLGRTDGRPRFPYALLRFVGARDNMIQKHVYFYQCISTIRHNFPVSGFNFQTIYTVTFEIDP